MYSLVGIGLKHIYLNILFILILFCIVLILVSQYFIQALYAPAFLCSDNDERNESSAYVRLTKEEAMKPG